nr:hypothetical protein [Gammaproteobacteria bacterium]
MAAIRKAAGRIGLWSLANRYQYFFSELMLVDHPRNPRRARSHDESAERVLRLEAITDETLGLLSVDVRQRLGAVAYQARIDAETSRFEPAAQAA